MSTPANHYYLSDEENAAVFTQWIEPAEFGHLPADRGSEADRPRPVCILIAGQTGAGKSHTAPALAAALRQSAASVSGQPTPPFCHLVADTHKPYHPAYAHLVAAAAAGQTPPGFASAATGHDARRWLARACAVAASRRCDALVESASRFPRDVAHMARTFRRAGYRVCIVLLAVHPAQSRLGLLARYLDAPSTTPDADTDNTDTDTNAAAATATADADVAETADASRPSLGRRLTPRNIHDESYVGLSQVAEWLDGSDDGERQPGDDGPLADALVILRRGNRVAYSNHWDQGDDATGPPSWHPNPPHISETLHAERHRRDISAETAMFESDVARLSAQHPERAAELAALAAEYAVDGDSPGVAAGGSAAGMHVLDPAVLVARLRRGY